jgi:hypothetical protein
MLESEIAALETKRAGELVNLKFTAFVSEAFAKVPPAIQRKTPPVSVTVDWTSVSAEVDVEEMAVREKLTQL